MEIAAAEIAAVEIAAAEIAVGFKEAATIAAEVKKGQQHQ